MPDVDLAAIRRELAESPLLADFNALVRDWGIRGAKVRTLTSERDGLIRDRDCFRSAWRVLKGLPPLPGFEVSPLDPVPPRVVGVIDETHVITEAELREAFGCPKPLGAPVSLQNAPADPGTRDTPLAPA